MMNGLEIQADLSERKGQDDNLKINATIYIDNSKENDLIQFITKAQQQGFNCLDLSKRNIKEFPSQLLEFTSLQYLYLEGNKLTQLPNDLFIRLSNLNWLDLRNNKLTSIPNYGLSQHHSLQYLLLSGNRLRTLPFELGKVKTLSALNLDGNPLDYPPYEIIKQGIKAIQQYLRDKIDSDHETSSDDDQQQTPKFHHHHSSLFHQKTNFESTSSNQLPSHLQSCIQYKRITYSAIRSSQSLKSRPQSAIKLSRIKSKTVMEKKNDSEKNFQEESLTRLKHHDIKIDEKIHPLHDKNFIKIDHEEHTSLHINPHYIQTINQDEQDIIKYESKRNHSPECIIKKDEERRIHDRQIQNRIRQITDKMLKRRIEARGSAFEDKRQIELELRELRRLESEGKQHQPTPIVHRIKTSNDNHKSRKKF